MKKFYKIKEDSRLGKRIANRKKYLDILEDKLVNYLADCTKLEASAFRVDNFLEPVVKEEFEGNFKNLLKKYGIKGYKYFKENTKIYKWYKEFLEKVEVEGLKWNEINLNAKDIDFEFGFIGCGYSLDLEKLIVYIYSKEYALRETLEKTIEECLVEIDELEYHKIRLG